MREPEHLKPAVHAACLRLLNERIRAAQAGLEQARESGTADTKSSAGDKHETARAMAQIELEKQGSVLRNLQEMDAVLLKIDPGKPVTRIAPGALLVTDQGLYYVATALGSMEIDGHTVHVISVQAPLLAAFAGLSAGDTATFRAKTYKLLQIC
ncbi:MAG: hypothetical protein KBH07_04665 [Flavobacteriales bacterium]|nr:hypothetical protein [Flavobacteriales bacterium]MBP9080202.1 hypothetical protein [Flavobacteriales bacterium]